MAVIVRDHDIESALAALHQQMVRDGIFDEMTKRRYYAKPSAKRRLRRARKRSAGVDDERAAP